MEAYGALLRFADKLGQSNMTATIAQEYLDAMPADRLGKVGDSPLLTKYLGNTAEIDPITSWVLLP
jgi:hypothetical protein